GRLDGAGLLAACLMPDHLHLACRPGAIGLTRWIGAMKSLSTRASWSARWRGVLWQPSFYDRRIRDAEVEQTLKYIVRNPVIAGLCDAVEDWPWSAVWE